MATATPPTSSTVFTFNPAVMVASGVSVTFSLSATVSMNPAMREHGAVAYAGMMVGPVGDGSGGSGPLTAALMILGLGLMAMPASRRRRTRMVLGVFILLAATQVGCHGSPFGNFNFRSSTQTVTSVAATNDGGSVTFSGLPASLGSIQTFFPAP